MKKWVTLRDDDDLLEVKHIGARRYLFLEVLDNFRDDGRLGGRVGIGHGQVRVSLSADATTPQDLPDWRTVVDQNRAEILNALQGLA